MRLGQLWTDESGQDLIEYSLLLALVALCILGLLTGMRGTTSSLWYAINQGMLSAQAAAS